ncbi:hypothetical protein DF039_12655 [Burkholderia cenocepacia]|nr:hypothetical protein DF039_12655 [Burkholderia cenocepacia]
MKFFAGVLLFGTWLGLVLARLAPAPALIDAIGYALVGLGIYHAAADDGNLVMKFIAGLLLFGAWLALVVVHLAPVAGLIDAIAYTLSGLGIYQAGKRGQALPSFVTGLLGGAVTGAATSSVAGASTLSDASAATAEILPPVVAAAVPAAEPEAAPANVATGAPVQAVAQPALVQ